MRGLYNASGSMLVNQVRLENISNNLSNLNTPGFKRSETLVRSFPDVLLYCIEKNQEGGGAFSPVGRLAQNVAIEETPFIQSAVPLADGQATGPGITGARFLL